MKDGSEFTEDELRELAIGLMEKEGKKAIDISRELGVGKSMVSRALNSEYKDVGTRTLKRIVAHLSDYEIEEVTTYISRKKTSK